MAAESGTILLVDDDQVVREVLAEDLTQEGFSIIQAENGEEGVALAIQRRPDLIISDIVMPRMDGWDFCYTLRLIPSTKTIPFVFLSSLDKAPDKILGIKLGADDYLTKPFSPDAVVHKIKTILKRVRDRREVLEKEQAECRSNCSLLLADVVEYLRHTQRTGLIAVYGLSKGVIYIKHGTPTHASYGSNSGEAAVFEMMKLSSSQVKYLEKEYPDLPKNLDIPWEALMQRLL